MLIFTVAGYQSAESASEVQSSQYFAGINFRDDNNWKYSENIHFDFLTHQPSIFRTTHSILEWFLQQNIQSFPEKLNDSGGSKMLTRMVLAMVNNFYFADFEKNFLARLIPFSAKITPFWSEFRLGCFTTHRYHEKCVWTESSRKTAPEHPFWPPVRRNLRDTPPGLSTDHFLWNSLQNGVILEWFFGKITISQNSTLISQPCLEHFWSNQFSTSNNRWFSPKNSISRLINHWKSLHFG